MSNACCTLLLCVMSAAVLTSASMAARAQFQPDPKESLHYYEPDKGEWREKETPLPARPIGDDLIEFYVSGSTRNQFYVEKPSLEVGEDGVVRSMLMIRSAAGVANVSYIGVRCDTREGRVYAIADSKGVWSSSRSNQWFAITADDKFNGHMNVLWRKYMCEGGGPRSIEQIVTGLKNSFSTDRRALY